jgi:hypothetical protein
MSTEDQAIKVRQSSAAALGLRAKLSRRATFEENDSILHLIAARICVAKILAAEYSDQISDLRGKPCLLENFPLDRLLGRFTWLNAAGGQTPPFSRGLFLQKKPPLSRITAATDGRRMS